jgi:chemotaxis protein MotB
MDAQRAGAISDDEAPQSAPAWIVTYSDMISLLLTFFIMLVSLGDVQSNGRYRAVLESIDRRRGYHGAPSAPSGESFPLNDLIERLKSLGAHTSESTGHGGVKHPGLPGNDLRVFTGREGTPVRAGDTVEFDRGSARVSQAAREVAKAIAQQLAGKPHKIEVRGHTSQRDLPKNCAFADKYTLSYERAWQVAKLLREQGIEPERLRLTAAGDSRPLPSTADQSARLGDRVEVYVLDMYARDFVGPREEP